MLNISSGYTTIGKHDYLAGVLTYLGNYKATLSQGIQNAQHCSKRSHVGYFTRTCRLQTRPTLHLTQKTRLLIGRFTWRNRKALQLTKAFAWDIFFVLSHCNMKIYLGKIYRGKIGYARKRHFPQGSTKITLGTDG